MDGGIPRTKFSKPIYERAAHRLVDTGGGVFSHPVGMAVHDDGRYTGGVLKPGHVFSIDPQLRVPEEHIYLRYEDVIVITEKGYENFTDFLPSELDDIEKLVGRRRDAPGVSAAGRNPMGMRSSVHETPRLAIDTLGPHYSRPSGAAPRRIALTASRCPADTYPPPAGHRRDPLHFPPDTPR